MPREEARVPVRFQLEARVSSESPAAVRRVLAGRFAAAALRRDGDDWLVRAEVEGESARGLNRELLSALRRVEKKTRLRAEWSAEGEVERFFDYVGKGKRPASPR